MKLSPRMQVRWGALEPREKIGVVVTAVLAGLAVSWWILLAPALQTWRGADARLHSLDAELKRMQLLQAQARAMQAQPKLSPDDALRALGASVKQELGANAQLIVSGDRATVTLKDISALALAQWWTQARINAHALPSEVQLSRNASSQASWDGTIVLKLPSH